VNAILLKKKCKKRNVNCDIFVTYSKVSLLEVKFILIYKGIYYYNICYT